MHAIMLCCAALCCVSQAHFSRAPLPITDYITDTKSVLDNTLRILQVGGVAGDVSAVVLIQFAPRMVC